MYSLEPLTINTHQLPNLLQDDSVGVTGIAWLERRDCFFSPLYWYKFVTVWICAFVHIFDGINNPIT